MKNSRKTLHEGRQLGVSCGRPGRQNGNSGFMSGFELEISVEVKCMCMYSVTARNSRDARQGEDLTITQAPHGSSNWLTEAGKSNVAVCVPNTAALAVQLPNQSVRGAWFEQARHSDEHGNRDFLNYLDGEKERVALNDLPRMTKIRVLRLFANNTRPARTIPATVNSDTGGELVGAGVSAGNRPGVFSRLFGSSD
jgi:hypothetical protein